VSLASERAGPGAVARVRDKVREAGAGDTGFLLLQRLLPGSVRIHPLALTGRRVARGAPTGLRGIRWGTRTDLARLPVQPDLRHPLARRFDSGERFCVLEEGRGAMRAATGTARAVDKTIGALTAKTGQPLVGGGTRAAKLPGRIGRGTANQDAFD
jgi:hypothetical protein